MWLCVAGRVVRDGSKDRSAFIFSVKKSNKNELFLLDFLTLKKEEEAAESSETWGNTHQKI